ncbi:MAG TPA: LptA/OstA family protein [Longimicrobiaceae bacterium]|jgi:lipopolysaccharide export system protein LptA|nr:LptA/OstA family protein [Longimicrobiaceae bacterium]
MRMRSAVLAALALLLPAHAAAQDRLCRVVESRQAVSTGVQPSVVAYISGPLLVVCTQGEQLRADSAVVYQAANEVQLFGRVDFQDPTRSLTSNNATYNSQTGRLYATGNVVFTDKERGSTLRGPELEYYRAMAGRPDAQMIAPQRPHLTLVPKASPGQARRDPLEVDGDRVTTIGNKYMTAEGNAVIRGKNLDARSAEAFYDADQERLELRRDAKVKGEKFDLSGDFVEAQLREGKIQRVLSRNDAHLVSEKLRVDGPLITLFFADELLQRLVAGSGATAGPGSAVAAAPSASAPATPPLAGQPVSPPAVRPPTPAPATAPAAGSGVAQVASAQQRPAANATGFHLDADSIEAILPAQQLQRVIAIGRAHGEQWDTAQTRADSVRRAGVARDSARAASRDSVNARNARGRPRTAGRDTAAARQPADSAAVVRALAVRDRDVIDADTIIGFFVQVDTAKARPRAPADTTKRPEPKTELDRMLAMGSAHALYRMREKDANGQPKEPGLNYVIGDTIDLTFQSGEIDVAHVLGLQRGIYLGPTPPAKADSAAADSAAARRTANGARPAGTPPRRTPARAPGTPASPPATPPPALPAKRP